MKLTVVGCSGSMSGPDSPASSYLIQVEDTEKTWSIVLDMGPGSFGSLWKYMDPRDLDALVFSHGHADHMADIISLEVHNRWHPTGRVGALDVYGPEGMEHRTRQIDGWAQPGSYDGVFNFITAEAGNPFHIGPICVEPFEAWHSVPTFGYRLSTVGDGAEQPSMAYTGDTDFTDSIVDMARDVDLLLCECGFTEEDQARGIHLSGERAGTLATVSGAKNLVLTHIQPWTPAEVVLREAEKTWGGPLSVARPGQVYRI